MLPVVVKLALVLSRDLSVACHSGASIGCELDCVARAVVQYQPALSLIKQRAGLGLLAHLWFLVGHGTEMHVVYEKVPACG